MPRHVSWRALWPGLALAGALAFGVFWVFVYARVGALRGDTYRIYSVTSDARGVLKGTEVWLAGQKVGLVAGIHFRPITSDTLRRLLMELEVLEEFQPLIRGNSFVQIRPGGTLIGQQVVAISTGTVSSPALAPGDTIVAQPQGDTETLASEIAGLGRAFTDVMGHAGSIREQLMTVSGVARLEDGEPGSIQLEVLRTRAEHLSSAAVGDGTVGLVLRGGSKTLVGRALAVTARADTLAQLLASDRTVFGQFRRDTTLGHHVAALRDEVSRVRALAAAPVGTIGRARTDDAIALELGELERRLDALIEDIKRRPLRYLHF